MELDVAALGSRQPCCGAAKRLDGRVAPLQPLHGDGKDKEMKANVRTCLGSPFADAVDDGDVGEEVVVLRGRHGSPQGVALLEVAHQDAQAVQVRVLRSDDLEDGLQGGGAARLREKLKDT